MPTINGQRITDNNQRTKRRSLGRYCNNGLQSVEKARVSELRAGGSIHMFDAAHLDGVGQSN